jgi:hypothetical protein
MPLDHIMQWIGNEQNNRILSGLTNIIQMIGIVVPATMAAWVYSKSARQEESDRIINFLADWNDAKRSSIRYGPYKYLDSTLKAR